MGRGIVAAVALAGAVAGCGGSSAAHTSDGTAGTCAAPKLSVAPTAVHPGGTTRASGKWFAADCYDMGQRSTPPPLTGMTIEVRQGGRTWTVASGVDAAGDRYAFRLPIRLPHDLHPGAARIAVPTYAAPVGIRVLPE